MIYDSDRSMKQMKRRTVRIFGHGVKGKNVWDGIDERGLGRGKREVGEYAASSSGLWVGTPPFGLRIALVQVRLRMFQQQRSRSHELRVLGIRCMPSTLPTSRNFQIDWCAPNGNSSHQISCIVLYTAVTAEWKWVRSRYTKVHDVEESCAETFQ